MAEPTTPTTAPAVETAVADATPAQTPIVATPAPEPEPQTEAHFQKALATALKEAGTVQEAKDRETANEAAKVIEDEKDKAPEPAKAEDKPPEPAKADDKPADKGTLGKARRLFAEGKIEEAIQLALGVDLDKVEPTTKQWKGVKRIAVEARQEAAAAKAEAANHIQQAQQALKQVMPFVDGAQAYIAGDFVKFLALTTGDTPETFQRKLIAQMHENPQGQSDPAIVREIEQLKRERAEERAAWQAEQKRVAAENNELKYRQAQQEWVSNLVTELKAIPQYAKAANKPAFVQQVFAVQQAGYDPKSQITYTTEEAAEMVWENLYGDVVDPPAAGAKTGTTPVPRANGAPTQHAGTSVAGTTTLRHSQATEAAPDVNGEWSPATQEKILERYTRMAQSEALARNS